MIAGSNETSEHAVIRSKAINYIKENWGLLDDLPSVFIPVVWVTVYRGLEQGSRIQSGGPQGLVKDMLLDRGRRTNQLQIATAKLKFLQTIIPQIRNQTSHEQRLADCYLFIDILRWNIYDAAEMGRFERLWKRISAKAELPIQIPSTTGDLGLNLNSVWDAKTEGAFRHDQKRPQIGAFNPRLYCRKFAIRRVYEYRTAKICLRSWLG